MHGNGRILYHSSGNQFKGKFMQGVREGFGEMHYAGGPSMYAGNWFSDQRHGQGVYTNENGDIYTGQWQQDVEHGEGIYIYHETKVH